MASSTARITRRMVADPWCSARTVAASGRRGVYQRRRLRARWRSSGAPSERAGPEPRAGTPARITPRRGAPVGVASSRVMMRPSLVQVRRRYGAAAPDQDDDGGYHGDEREDDQHHQRSKLLRTRCFHAPRIGARALVFRDISAAPIQPLREGAGGSSETAPLARSRSRTRCRCQGRSIPSSFLRRSQLDWTGQPRLLPTPSR